MKPTAIVRPDPDRALPATKWAPLFISAELLEAVVGDAKTPRARAIRLGQWLGARVGRPVAVCHDGRSGTATLRAVALRSNEKRYYFEVAWDESQPPDGGVAAAGPAVAEPPPVPPPASLPLVAGGNGEEW